MNWTEEDLRLRTAALARVRSAVVLPPIPKAIAVKRDTSASMNKTERDYSERLAARIRAGEIANWRFQKITLLIGRDDRLTIDFVITHNDGHIQFMDTKARWAGSKHAHVTEDAREKMVSAAEQFPEFDFAITWKEPNGEWKEKVFLPLGCK